MTNAMTTVTIKVSYVFEVPVKSEKDLSIGEIIEIAKERSEILEFFDCDYKTEEVRVENIRMLKGDE